MTTDRRTIVGLGVIAVAVVPFLLGSNGAGDDADGLRDRRRRVEGMTELERDRLADRFRRYRELDPAARAALREVHEAVEREPELRSTLERYRRWLQTLSPWQREQLRQVGDPDERLELVRRYRAEQEEDRDRDWRRGGRFRWRGSRLSEEDLAAMLDVLAERTVDSPSEREQIAGKEGLSRWLAIVELAFRRSRGPGSGRGPAIDEPTMDAMIAALDDEEVRKELRAIEDANVRRSSLLRRIGFALLGEIRRDEEARKPDDDALRKFFVSLPDAERDELMSLPQDEFERELTERYVRRDVPEYAEARPLLYGLLSGRPFGGRPDFRRRRDDDRRSRD